MSRHLFLILLSGSASHPGLILIFILGYPSVRYFSQRERSSFLFSGIPILTPTGTLSFSPPRNFDRFWFFVLHQRSQTADSNPEIANLFPLMFLNIFESSPGLVISLLRIRGIRASRWRDKTVDEVSSI